MGKITPKKISSYLSGFLRVLNKPQRKYFLIYLVGLIGLIKFRSIREIAHHFGQDNTDGLHQFIKASPKKVQRLLNDNQRQIVQHVGSSSSSVFIIDDTSCPRKGEKIDGIGLHYGAEGFLRGLCAVTALVKTGSKRLAWTLQGYRPKSTCPKHTFKSKVTMAFEILSQVIAKFPVPMTVLMDSWYSCASILNLIQHAGWIFLVAVKRNRIIEVGGRKTSLSLLAKAIRKYKTIPTKNKRFRIAKRLIHLPRIGTVLLFISKSREGQVRFFITNNLKMTESQMVGLYTQRVWIETFHQDIKQHLGFREMFMRSWDGIQTHWTVLLIAYNTVALSNGNRSRSFRQMIRHFRNSIPLDEVLTLHKQLKFNV